MPMGLFGWGPLGYAREIPERTPPCQGKRRGVTQSTKRAKRRNRRKP